MAPFNPLNTGLFRRRRLLGIRYAPGRARMAVRAGVPLFKRGIAAIRNRAATKIQTMFRKKRRNPMVKKIVRGAIGGQATFSKWAATNRASRRVKAMKLVGAANYYITNEAAQLLTTQGFQQAGAWAFQNTADLKQIALNVPGGGSGLVPRQYVLQSCTVEYMITNSTLATMYIDVYDVIRRRDADLSLSTASKNPREAWVNGVSDQTGTIDPTAFQNINSLPTDSRFFKDYFKVVQRNHIALSQGATHRHHVVLKSNKLIDTALLNNKEDDEDLAGLSVYTMIVVYGQPASITPEIGPAVVTTAEGAIDVVKACRYKYTWVQDTANNFYYQDNLSSLTGEQVVSAGAGVFLPNQKV